MNALQLQKWSWDCGPTALQGALTLWGKKTKHTDLCRWAGSTPSKGTSAAGLKRVLERLHVPFREYCSKSRRASWDWARNLRTPAVLSFDADEHWILLVAGVGRRVMVYDPEYGYCIYNRQDFLSRWVHEGRCYGIQLHH